MKSKIKTVLFLAVSLLLISLSASAQENAISVSNINVTPLADSEYEISFDVKTEGLSFAAESIDISYYLYTPASDVSQGASINMNPTGTYKEYSLLAADSLKTAAGQTVSFDFIIPFEKVTDVNYLSVADSYGNVKHITDINLPGTVKTLSVTSGGTPITALSVKAGSNYMLGLSACDGYGNTFTPGEAVWRAVKDGKTVGALYVNSSNKLFVSDNDPSIEGSYIDLICSVGNVEKIIKVYIEESSSQGTGGAAGIGGGGGGAGAGGGGITSSPIYVKPDKDNEQTADQEAHSVFPDIDSDAWYMEDISRLFIKGIVKGDADGNIRPEENITREELVSVVVRALNLTSDGAEMIDDPTVSDWAVNEMSIAVANGIITGDEKGVINGTNLCSRQDAAVILGRAFNIAAGDKQTFFADGGEISEYAAEFVNSLSSSGYINGYEDGTFRPQNNITRAELFVILGRIIG